MIYNKEHYNAVAKRLRQLGYECVYDFVKKDDFNWINGCTEEPYFVPTRRYSNRVSLTLNQLYIYHDKFRYNPKPLPTNTPLPYPEYKPPAKGHYLTKVIVNTSTTGCCLNWDGSKWSTKLKVIKFMIIDWSETPEPK